jgi:hypothetical protein
VGGVVPLALEVAVTSIWESASQNTQLTQHCVSCVKFITHKLVSFFFCIYEYFNSEVNIIFQLFNIFLPKQYTV